MQTKIKKKGKVCARGNNPSILSKYLLNDTVILFVSSSHLVLLFALYFLPFLVYSQICNVLNTYYNNNKKIVFECLWILSRLVYDSQDKEMFYFLLNEKCLELYKKIILLFLLGGSEKQLL